MHSIIYACYTILHKKQSSVKKQNLVVYEQTRVKMDPLTALRSNTQDGGLRYDFVLAVGIQCKSKGYREGPELQLVKLTKQFL